MKARRYAIPIVIASLLFALGIVYLLFSHDTTAPLVDEPQPSSLQLKWLMNAGFVGDIYAAEHRLWKDLEVDLRPGGPGVDAIKAVTSGSADFGVATGDQILLAVNQGFPVIAIALAYRQNPLAWIVRADSGIAQAADFRGKRVGLTFFDDEALFLALLSRTGLTKNDLTIVPVKFDLTPFLTGDIDAYPVFSNTQGVEIAHQLSEQGINTRLISIADVGIESYSNLYFTTKSLLSERPELVRRFVAGIREGWRAAKEDPASASESLSKLDYYASTNTSLSVVRQSVEKTLALVYPQGDTLDFGVMTLQGWDSTRDVLVAVQPISPTLDLSTLFTNDFL